MHPIHNAPVPTFGSNQAGDYGDGSMKRRRVVSFIGKKSEHTTHRPQLQQLGGGANEDGRSLCKLACHTEEIDNYTD